MSLMKWIADQSFAVIMHPAPRSVAQKGWSEGARYECSFQSEPEDGDTKLSLMDPFDSVLEIPDDRLLAATTDPKTNTVHIPLDDGDLKLMFFAMNPSSVPGGRPTLGARKAEEIGEVIGTLARNSDGRVAAVTDMGRVTWLTQDVEGGQPDDAPTMEKALAIIADLRNHLLDSITEDTDEKTADFGVSATWDAEDFLRKAGVKVED